ncbi:Calx-beta domain-containing protein [Acetanaerobacterium elongatum]|uniref:Calx-beta domain-containing protein n=1 Tax=Acetanaerobacterium elongatum TaxID=258515 RepID=A0A1H0FSP6_9FIRM|nr:LamG-like jellyroll fold domain-containing protein [Acetanaerobacterium elongatum]SDN97614.1 Calx-beta domain-containing protein [Acetanaerobacterium elongatum]
MKKRIIKPVLCLLTLLMAMGLLLPVSAAGEEAFYIGNAIHFAKTQDTLYYSGHISDQLDNLTMETWVKPTTDFSNMDIPNIRIMYNGNSGKSGYGIYLHGPNKSPSILFGCIGWLVASNVKLTQNQWCHLAATRDSLASGGTWHLYVNGVEQSLTQEGAIKNQTPIGYTNTDESFSIGNNNLVSENFTGCFDEVRFWNVCRTADEIKNNMYTKPDTDAESNLIAYYNFERTTGFTVSPSGDNTALSGIPVPNMAKSGGYNLTAAGFSLTGSVSNFVNSVALGSFGFQIANASVKENAGAIAATVIRTDGSEGSVTIHYQTQDGTGGSAALSGTHYTATQGAITFGEGETSKVITVPIINDSLDGTDRHFSIMLTGPNGVTINPATATVTITPKAKISTTINGITPPEKGSTPVLSLNTNEYSALVEWSPSHAEFQSGTQYTATITLTPQSDYTLKGIPDNAFQITGALNAQYTAGTGKIIAKFPGIPYDAPAVGEGYSIDYKNETVSIYSGYEASEDSEFSSLLTSGCSITNNLGQPLYIRKAAGGEIPASTGTSFAIPARPAAPVNIGTINESILGAGDGKITNVDSTMEYRQDAQTVWAAITGTEITNLPGGIYHVRYKSDTNKFASEATQIAINSNATVGESTILGITPPAAGLVPAASVTETAQYTGTVTWSPDHAVFQSGNQYTATITLTPKADYTFTGVPENSFTVPGAIATNPANTSIITAVFPSLPFDAPADGEGYNIDYINETILLTNGYQAGTDSGFTSLISSGSVTGYLGQTIYIRKSADGEIPASAGTGFAIPARLSAPAGIGTANESYPDAGDGKITNVDSTMEYKKDAEPTWTGITGFELTGLTGGTYYIRLKAADKDIDPAVSAESFASLAASITVQTTGTTPEPAPAADIDYETEQLTGLIANAKYLIDGASYTADANGKIVLYDQWFGNTSLSLVRRGNGTTTTDSTAQSLPVPARPATAPTVNGHAQVGSVKGKITGVTTEMEYSDGSGWIACTGDSITELAAGTYHVRYRASNTAKKFASAAADVVITKISVTQVPGEVTDPGSVGIEPIGEAFSVSVEVRIQKSSVTDDAIRDAIKASPALRDNSLSMFSIDISIYEEGTNTRVQPNEGTSVRITYPIPAELLAGKNRLMVVCIENGKLVILPTKVVKRGNIECIEFTATHFSPYAIIDNRGALSYSPSETITSNFLSNNPKPTIPETGFDTLDWIIWGVLGNMSALFF